MLKLLSIISSSVSVKNESKVHRPTRAIFAPLNDWGFGDVGYLPSGGHVLDRIGRHGAGALLVLEDLFLVRRLDVDDSDARLIVGEEVYERSPYVAGEIGRIPDEAGLLPQVGSGALFCELDDGALVAGGWGADFFADVVE